MPLGLRWWGWWLGWLLAGVPAAAGPAAPSSTHFEFFHAPGHQPLATDLAALAEPRWLSILADLGIGGPERIEVFLCDGLSEMQHNAPTGTRVPAWAAGMAFDRHDRVLLRVDSRTGRGEGLAHVFVHELAHLALSQAVGSRELPRWFHEGFAIHQSGEWSLGRVTTLASGVLSGRLFSLQSLTESFPASPPDVQLAYAQSIDFVAYLLAEQGRDRFHRLVELLGRGWGFVEAIEEAYDTNIFRLEDDWHADLKMRFTWLPVLTGSATLWGLATLVLVAAWIRKRRTHRLRLAGMQADPPDENDLPPPPLTPSSP